jgi:hypothetical protein
VRRARCWRYTVKQLVFRGGGVARYRGGQRYRLELRALEDDIPAVVRLRRLLKALLRGYGSPGPRPWS